MTPMPTTEPDTYTIYIDTNTGAWGDASGLVQVTLTAEEQDVLLDASDSAINDYGLEHGTPLATKP